MKKIMAMSMLMFALAFNIYHTAEAVDLSYRGRTISYDEHSLYVIDRDRLEFRVVQFTGSGADTAWYQWRGEYVNNQPFVRVGILSNGEYHWRKYPVWGEEAPYGVIFRNVWKRVYGYGFS